MRYFIKLSDNESRLSWLANSKNRSSVEEVIEKCLSHLFGKNIDIIGSGRKVMHAKEFFANLDYEKQLY